MLGHTAGSSVSKRSLEPYKVVGPRTKRQMRMPNLLTFNGLCAKQVELEP
jgi:hypothetical protein